MQQNDNRIKMNLDLHVTTYIQIKSKWTVGLNIRAKTIMLLEKQGNLHGLQQFLGKRVVLSTHSYTMFAYPDAKRATCIQTSL